MAGLGMLHAIVSFMLLLCYGNSFSSWNMKSMAPLRSTKLDGIPKMFRWLTEQYPKINRKIEQGTIDDKENPIDNLYLDMNGIIHMCTHNNDNSIELFDEERMLKKIMLYTDRLYKLVKPRRLLYLAVDGVAPRAKMNQQRSRRFRSSKEQEVLLAKYIADGNSKPIGDGAVFDSNCITPGTDFMVKLNHAFKDWVKRSMKTDPFWKKHTAHVIFSGSDVPGEGEHKIMEYIRKARVEEAWSPDLRHVMYGLDADLIMLTLVTHEKNFMLLREKLQVRHSPKDPLRYIRSDFEVLEVSLLRECLSLHYQSKGEAIESRKMERIIDDFVFLCMLVGNDFIPHLPHLDIGHGSLGLLLDIYKKMLANEADFLTDKADINLGFFERFAAKVATSEYSYFQSRGNKEGDAKMAKKSTYRKLYYSTKFEWNASDVQESKLGLIRDYVDGLHWVLEYYHHGVGSWNWFFPHLYGPLVSDMTDLTSLSPSFLKGKAVTPLMQLLSVLPAESGRLLPGVYRELMTDRLSPLAEFYPRQFKVDQNGKRNDWEAVVKIPFIDEALMDYTVSYIDHETSLTKEEQERNSHGIEHVFKPLSVTPTTKNSQIKRRKHMM